MKRVSCFLLSTFCWFLLPGYQFCAFAAAPRIVTANCFDGRTVGIEFDQAVEPASATDIANYVIEGPGVAVASARLEPDSKTVTLRLADEIFDSSFVLRVRGVQGMGGEAADTFHTTSVNNFRAVHVGRPEVDPVEDGAVRNVRGGEFRLEASSAGLGGTADDFLFVAEPWDEPVVLYNGWVRAVDSPGVNAAGGLMVRESIEADSAFLAVLATPLGTTANRSFSLAAYCRKAHGEVVLKLSHTETFPAQVTAPEVGFDLLRSERTVSVSLWTNRAESALAGPIVEFTQAFSGGMHIGIVAVPSDQATQGAQLVEIFDAGALRGDFPPSPQVSVSLVGGALTFQWAETSAWRFHLASTAVLEPMSSWTTVRVWPTREAGRAEVTLPVAQVQQFFSLRLSR